MSYASDLIEEEGLCEHGNAREFCWECNNSDKPVATCSQCGDELMFGSFAECANCANDLQS